MNKLDRRAYVAKLAAGAGMLMLWLLLAGGVTPRSVLAGMIVAVAVVLWAPLGDL